MPDNNKEEVYECFNCKQPFCADGLQLVIHEKTIARICPECLSGVLDFSLEVSRELPHHTFKLEYYLKMELYGVNPERRG